MVYGRFVAATTLLALCATPAIPKKAPKTSDAELQQITERGRELYAYDQAAWHSSDAAQALHPKDGEVRRYIAQKTSNGWIVAYGHLNDTRDAFLITYLAVQGKTLDDFSVQHFAMPQEDTGFLLSAAKAIDLALKNFRGENRPYNVAVLPAPNSQLYVYVLPAQTKDGVYPIGGDERYTVSSNGETMIEDHRMHQGILDFDTHNPNVANIAAGYHVHVLSEVPEDSDVFFVLTRRPAVPEYIGANGKMLFVIQTDGSIAHAK